MSATFEKWWKEEGYFSGLEYDSCQPAWEAGFDRGRQAAIESIDVTPELIDAALADYENYTLDYVSHEGMARALTAVFAKLKESV